MYRTITANTPTQVNTHTLGVEVHSSISAITVDYSYNNITSASTVDGHQLISTHDNNVYKYNGSTITASGTTYYELDAYDGSTPAKLYNLYDEPLASQTLFSASSSDVVSQGSLIDYISARTITVNAESYLYNYSTESVGGVDYYKWDGNGNIYTASETPSVGDSSYILNETMTAGSTATAATVQYITVGSSDYIFNGNGLNIGGMFYHLYIHNNDSLYALSDFPSAGDNTYTYSGTVTASSTVTSYDSSTASIIVDGETYEWYYEPRPISGAIYYRWSRLDETLHTYVSVFTTTQPGEITSGDTTYTITNESMVTGSAIDSVTRSSFTVDNVDYSANNEQKQITIGGSSYTYLEYVNGSDKLYVDSLIPYVGMITYTYSNSISVGSAITAKGFPGITVGGNVYSGNDTFKTISGVNYYEYVNGSDKLYSTNINPVSDEYSYTISSTYTVTPYTTLGMPFSVSGTGMQVATDKVSINGEYSFSGSYIINNDSTAPFKIGLITATTPVVSEQTFNKVSESTWVGHIQWGNALYNVWSDSENLSAGDDLYFSQWYPEYNHQTVKSVTPASVNCTVSYSVTGENFTQVGSALTDTNNVVCNIPKYVYLKFSQDVIITEE